MLVRNETIQRLAVGDVSHSNLGFVKDGDGKFEAVKVVWNVAGRDYQESRNSSASKLR